MARLYFRLSTDFKSSKRFISVREIKIYVFSTNFLLNMN